MKTERRLPKIRKRRAVAIVLGFVALNVASLIWPILVWFVGVGLIAVLVSFYYLRCCPQCNRRMKFRAEPLRWQGSRSRILFDCNHCHTVWDSGEIQDESLG